jgi:outer membrane protein assembly factor BamB
VTPDSVVAGADAQAGGGIHALDRATGRQRWSFPAGIGVTGPITGNAHHAFAATAQREVVSLDIASGTVTWRVPLSVPGFEGPSLAGARVFAGSVDGSLVALNAETGKQEWRIALGSPVTTSVAAVDSDLYVGTENGTLHRIDARRGVILGAKKLDDQLRPRSVPVRTGDGVLVLLADAGASYRALVSLDRELRTVRWRQNAASAWSTSRVFVHRTTALVGTSSGDVTGYCTADGAKAWSGSVRGIVRAIGGADDALYVGTPAGTLYALAPLTVCEKRGRSASVASLSPPGFPRLPTSHIRR